MDSNTTRQLAEPRVETLDGRRTVIDADIQVPRCKCGEELLNPAFDECGRCYRDAKGDFEFERSDE